MSDIGQIMFFGFAIIAVISAILVITGRNLFHAAMSLGLYLLTIAGYYFMLDADLVGIMQVFVYVGGVIVALLFGIMLTSQMTNVRSVSAMKRRASTVVAVAALVGLLISVFRQASFYISPAEPIKDTTSVIGRLFLTDYVLPFEVISVLLLAALIGAVVIAKGEDRS